MIFETVQVFLDSVAAAPVGTLVLRKSVGVLVVLPPIRVLKCTFPQLHCTLLYTLKELYLLPPVTVYAAAKLTTHVFRPGLCTKVRGKFGSKNTC